MDKDLILKYKAEFDYWLNEGNVQTLYKSATQIGTNKAIKTASNRIIKDTVKVSNPLAKVAILAALGAVVSYFLNKR